MAFDLEQFKKGQLAKTRTGHLASFVGMCPDGKMVAHFDKRGVREYTVCGTVEGPGMDWDLVDMVKKEVTVESVKNGKNSC